MRNMREVFRLHYELQLGQRQIARSVQLSPSTVHEYLERFHAAGLSWPLPTEMTEAEFEHKLFAAEAIATRQSGKTPPDFKVVHEELQHHKHITLQLLWEEYRQQTPDGYGYSQFCYHYQRWKQKSDLTLRQEHRAGEKLFVDWAGDTIPLYDPATGKAQAAQVFVAVLGASNYTYAEATLDQRMGNWIGAHVRCLEFLGGCPELIVPDNTKTGVSKACRYEPELNPTYQEMATHYGVGVLATRPRKPRDKAKVEVGVQIAERWILAALRHSRFFSLAELNRSIGELLTKLNQRKFKKRDGSRQSLFQELDQPALRPLPAERFDLAEWSLATVNIDYHVQCDKSFYSVPYQFARQKVEVRATPSTVEIFHEGKRVASHVRTHKANAAITDPQHRPASHRAHLDWPPSRMIQWAATLGPRTSEVIKRILKAYPHPEMGYRSCLGIIRLGQRYPAARVEAAAERALRTGAVSYKSLTSILRHSLDQQPLDPSPSSPLSGHENIRGAEYYK
jgi:transposase